MLNIQSKCDLKSIMLLDEIFGALFLPEKVFLEKTKKKGIINIIVKPSDPSLLSEFKMNCVI